MRDSDQDTFNKFYKDEWIKIRVQKAREAGLLEYSPTKYLRNKAPYWVSPEKLEEFNFFIVREAAAHMVKKGKK